VCKGGSPKVEREKHASNASPVCLLGVNRSLSFVGWHLPGFLPTSNTFLSCKRVLCFNNGFVSRYVILDAQTW